MTGNGSSQPMPRASKTRFERASLALLFVIMLVLRVAYAFHGRSGTDEPQHLHVVWGWTRGMIQYRDFFDNHTPLFHMASAPFLTLLGERANALEIMRLLMIPVFFVSLWSIRRISAALFSREVAIWSPVVAGLFPAFFLASRGFKTDNPWTMLWLLGLAFLVHGTLTARRSLAAGIIFGTALSVSLKTTLLLASLGSAILIALLASLAVRRRPDFKHGITYLFSFLTGLVAIPACLAIFFISVGAWHQLVYCVVDHNTVPGFGRQISGLQRSVLFVVLAVTSVVSGLSIKYSRDLSVGIWRGVIFSAPFIYLGALISFWPVLTGQDYLPFYPLPFIFVTAGVAVILNRLATRLKNRWLQVHLSTLVLSAVSLGELSAIVIAAPPRKDHSREQVGLVAAALALTEPADFIMDTKGETIFRNRPTYSVLESITNYRLRRGLISDDIPERLVATRTCVAVLDNERLPRRARAFLNENYISVGVLRVAGHLLPVSPASNAIRFNVEIPARYVLVSIARNEVSGVLDGSLYEGPRFLERGTHEFLRASSPDSLALVWARAIERGRFPVVESPRQPAEDE